MARCEQCGTEAPPAASVCARCGAEIAAPDPLLGQEVLDRYRIIRLVGEGGMGRVYEALQRVGTTSRRVAVKTLLPQLSHDPQIARRFFREAEIIVRLSHPNIIQLFDFGTLANGTLAIAMEFIEGHSLAAELSKGPIEPVRVERILAQICGALAEAHALGIVHRDLKPDNVLLTARAGQPDFVKVLDFGIAKISEDERSTKLTQQGMMVGTPPYMSPEQFSGDTVDACSDIYSLGVIAYEMLSGRLPFEARTPWEWASKHLTAPPLPLSQATEHRIPRRHAQAIERAMAKNPRQRQPSVAQFLEELVGQPQRAQLPAQPPAPPTGILPRAVQGTPARPESVALPQGAPSSRKWTVQLGAGVLLTAASALAWFGLDDDEGSDAEWAALDPPPLPEPAAATPDLAPPPSSPGLLRNPSDDPSRSPGQVSPQAPVSVRPKRGASTQPVGSERAQARQAAPSRASAPAPEPPPPTANPVPPPSPASNAPQHRDAAPRVEHLSGPAAADLQARVERALAAATEQVETAVGLYQAAAARYGAEQLALAPLRAAIAQGGERRIRELLAQGRCAQAQAFLRALHGVGVGGSASQLFGAGCPRP